MLVILQLSKEIAYLTGQKKQERVQVTINIPEKNYQHRWEQGKRVDKCKEHIIARRVARYKPHRSINDANDPN